MALLSNNKNSVGAGFSLSPSLREPAIVPALFLLLLAACNIHLLTSDSASVLCFDLDGLQNGEWWRILTHPFVHVSWYHLALDAAAVAILWHEIKLTHMGCKLFAAGCCAAFSLIISLIMSPVITQYGLCGLSGTAHGLMFFLGLHWMFDTSLVSGKGCSIRLAGGVILVCLSGLKSIYEALTGHILFFSMHTGDLGIPIVESHLGGIIGGAFAFLLIKGQSYINSRFRAKISLPF